MNHQLMFIEAAKTKDWIRDPEKCIYVDYSDKRQEYEVTVFWIEDWKPGNLGFRIRGDMVFDPNNTDYSAVLDNMRQEMLEFNEEIGRYPVDEQKWKAYREAHSG